MNNFLLKTLTIFGFFSIFLILNSCSLYDTPELPDVNQESFSYEEMMEKKDKLISYQMEKVDNKYEGKNERQ
ncbi:MAG: hypothetical protein IJ730_04360 [Alphaproteobacteria bacterium]|nr:hypothetical protein [Alphaproteobacteria bacterium]